MKYFLLSLILFQLINISINDNIDLSTYYKTFIKNNGYKLEEHEITTTDG